MKNEDKNIDRYIAGLLNQVEPTFDQDLLWTQIATKKKRKRRFLWIFFSLNICGFLAILFWNPFFSSDLDHNLTDDGIGHQPKTEEAVAIEFNKSKKTETELANNKIVAFEEHKKATSQTDVPSAKTKKGDSSISPIKPLRVYKKEVKNSKEDSVARRLDASSSIQNNRTAGNFRSSQKRLELDQDLHSATHMIDKKNQTTTLSNFEIKPLVADQNVKSQFETTKISKLNPKKIGWNTKLPILAISEFQRADFQPPMVLKSQTQSDIEIVNSTKCRIFLEFNNSYSIPIYSYKENALDGGWMNAMRTNQSPLFAHTHQMTIGYKLRPSIILSTGLEYLRLTRSFSWTTQHVESETIFMEQAYYLDQNGIRTWYADSVLQTRLSRRVRQSEQVHMLWSIPIGVRLEKDLGRIAFGVGVTGIFNLSHSFSGYIFNNSLEDAEYFTEKDENRIFNQKVDVSIELEPYLGWQFSKNLGLNLGIGLRHYPNEWLIKDESSVRLNIVNCRLGLKYHFN